MGDLPRRSSVVALTEFLQLTLLSWRWLTIAWTIMMLGLIAGLLWAPAQLVAVVVSGAAVGRSALWLVRAQKAAP